MDLHHQFASVLFPLGFQYSFEIQESIPLTESEHWLVRDNKLVVAYMDRILVKRRPAAAETPSPA